MGGPALTRASTMGPLLDAVEQGGGSAARVFRAAELPMRLADAPGVLVPLADQMRLVESAAREIGDDALPARLSTTAGLDGLGAFGALFLDCPDLRSAIRRGNAAFTTVLQSRTSMRLALFGGEAHWTYHVDAPAPVGRQKNEMLALGYMTGMLRRILGADAGMRAALPGRLDGRARVEDVLRCDVSEAGVASVWFDADLLDAPIPRRPEAFRADADRALPADDAFMDTVEAVIGLELLAGPPRREAVARRLGLSLRSLQRRLEEQGTSFAALLQAVRQRSAIRALAEGRPVSSVAADLGYADTAHFTRAFTGWTGLAPTVFAGRRSARS